MNGQRNEVDETRRSVRAQDSVRVAERALPEGKGILVKLKLGLHRYEHPPLEASSARLTGELKHSRTRGTTRVVKELACSFADYIS